MKSLIFLFLPFIGFSQTAVVNQYVVTTPTRDKVWIIKNTSGQLIYQSWTCDICEKTWNGMTPTVRRVSKRRFEKLQNKYKK